MVVGAASPIVNPQHSAGDDLEQAIAFNLFHLSEPIEVNLLSRLRADALVANQKTSQCEIAAMLGWRPLRPDFEWETIDHVALVSGSVEGSGVINLFAHGWLYKNFNQDGENRAPLIGVYECDFATEQLETGCGVDSLCWADQHYHKFGEAVLFGSDMARLALDTSQRVNSCTVCVIEALESGNARLLCARLWIALQDEVWLDPAPTTLDQLRSAMSQLSR